MLAETRSRIGDRAENEAEESFFSSGRQISFPPRFDSNRGKTNRSLEGPDDGLSRWHCHDSFFPRFSPNSSRVSLFASRIGFSEIVNY